MPTQPTCKVVKREGQRGACIDPKGCKVRTTKDAQGNKKKENKQGNEKIKRTTTNRDMRLAVAGSPQRHLIANWNDRPQNFRSNYKRNHNMVYDTGANITSMTPAALQHIGYNPNRTTNVYHVNSGDASGNVIRRKVLRDVKYHLLLKSDKDTSGNRTRQWVTITTDVLVMPSNLLGVNSIKLLKSRFKVKFK